MKKVLLLSLFLSLLVFAQKARSQGLENFNNYPETSNAYHNGTFTGQDGSTWTYNQCRGDSAINAPTPTLGKNRTPIAEVFSGTLHGGCGTLSFDYKQVFSTSVSLDVYVNGILLTTVTSNSEQGIVKNSGTINVNTAGDFVLDFKQNSTSAGQCAIDNVSWTGNSTVLPEPTNYPTAFTATPGYFKVILHWTDAVGGQLPTSYLIMASTTNSFTAPVDGTPVPDDANLADGSAALNILPGVQTCSFTGLVSNTPYYFTIYPYTNSGTLVNYKTDGTAPTTNATTPNGVIIFHRDFNDTIIAPMIPVSVVGAQVWGISKLFGTGGTGCASMSGYAGGVYVQNEDWLITPSMNFDLYTNEVLTFMNSFNYTGNPLEAKISNDYSGSGDPNSATWVNVPFTLSPGGFTWTSSGDLDVSAINGANVYVAYKYTSTTSNSSTWELDDIYVMGTPLVGIGEKISTPDFVVSPNPSQGIVKLAFGMKGNKDIRIMNVTGRNVYQETTGLDSRTLDLTNLPAGIYFVQVTDEMSSKTTVKKLIIR